MKRSANDLQQVITRASVREAETLKTICRVYEDARFPIVEMKPDLALSNRAERRCGVSLSLSGARAVGFNVPLTYNIVVGKRRNSFVNSTESRRNRFSVSKATLKYYKDRREQTVVAVPCHVSLPGNGKDKTLEIYAFCTCFDQTVPVTSRQMEILSASSDVLARLIEDEDERHAKPSPEEIAHIRHPRGSFKDILTIDPG